jgi:hypothetical protein
VRARTRPTLYRQRETLPEGLTGAWRELGRFAGDHRVPVAPFDAVASVLTDLWLPTPRPA